jgi:hypothetical protein
MTVWAVDKAKFGYDLGASNYDNSPSNYDNSKSNYDNSVSNYDNSPSNYDNSKSNYDNGRSGQRRLVSSDGKWLGYYVKASNGTLNFYSTKGERVFYHPNNKSTLSVFYSAESAWAGSLIVDQGEVFLGLDEKAYLFLLYSNQ